VGKTISLRQKSKKSISITELQANLQKQIDKLFRTNQPQ